MFYCIFTLSEISIDIRVEIFLTLHVFFGKHLLEHFFSRMSGIQRREWLARLKYGGLAALTLFISIFVIKGKIHNTQFQINIDILQLLSKINFRFSMINVLSMCFSIIL